MTTYLGDNLISGVAYPTEPSRNIGQIIPSMLPLTDAGLHLLDGSKILGGGVYDSFVNYIANLYVEKEETFIQPKLTSNGTMGGNSFAVEASSYNPSNPTREPYMSFDGNSATKWGVYNTTSGWLTFYNPKPLKVSSIVYTPSSDYPNEDGGAISIHGSNDNSTWTSLSGTIYTGNSVITFDVESPDFYKYYRISISNGVSSWVGLGNLTINATYMGTPKYFCTESEWQDSVNTYGVCGKFVYTPARTSYYAWYISANGAGSTLYYTTSTTVSVGDKIYTKSGNSFVEQATLTSGDSGWNVYNSQPRYNYYGTTRKSIADEIGSPATVRLPKITGLVEGTTDVTALGDLIEQFVRLPNIWGYFNTIGDNNGQGSTRITYLNQSQLFDHKGSGGWGWIEGITFDSSWSSSVYSGDGTNTKIQQQAIKMFYYIVIATNTKTEIEVDIDEVVTDLNNKVDASLPHVTEVYKNGASWYRKWSDGFCEQGGFITGNGSYGVLTVNLLVPYADANYVIYGTQIAWDNSTWYTGTFTVGGNGLTDVAGSTQNKTINGFQVQTCSNRYWMTSGYIN